MRSSCVPDFRAALLPCRHAFRPIAKADGLGGNRLRAAVPDGFAAASGVTAMLRNSDRGQFRLASRFPGKGDCARTVAYFAGELERLDVEVRTGRAMGGSIRCWRARRR